MTVFKKILKWAVVAIVVGYVAVVLVRIPHFYNLRKTQEQVARIHATKLTLADVMGDNLPPDPGALADATIQGVDANQNGIRDDVELAIFREYPDSAKTRAVLLQYALALQMEVLQPFVNTEVVTEVVREQSRADSCISDELVPRKSPESPRSYSDIEKIDTYINFVKDRQLNTEARKAARKDFLGNLGSYGESENDLCDIDSLLLPN
jgi:hypothetical protein